MMVVDKKTPYIAESLFIKKKMMRKLLMAAIASFLLVGATIAQDPDMWALFSKTRFVEKLNREFGMYFLYPRFPDELKEIEGKTVTVSGFYIPLDMNNSNIAIVSKFPMAECFFCGGAGPESIVVGYLKNKPNKRFKTDEIVKIRGKLKLNEDDIEELNFILIDAEFVN
ncbi:hypothetical protein GCM10008106_21620 [Mongoliitalea lutea]|uniref:DUF3299 domain-containing protein n=2 Tax=Mongoliitalea lutea TaxID=849756 RepID=A0A8J3G605_9BACT|nr:hypothetical protein GCM10008106_21620 [Mongoliitalea lutea]